MALTVTPQILGQETVDTVSYCYMLEPLKVHITDDEASTTEIYIDVTRLSTETGSPELDSEGIELIRTRYVVREVISEGAVVVDLMAVAAQLHDFNKFEISKTSDIQSNWKSVLSEWKYKFKIYTNSSTPSVNVLKLPIIGGRDFENFTPVVDYNTPLSFLSLDQMVKSSILRAGSLIPFFTLKDLSTVTVDLTPNVSMTTPTEGLGSTNNCGGILYWKSKKGGWESFGMDLADEKRTHNYKGRVAVSLFESTQWSGGGDAYIQPSYTSIDSNYSVSLKCLSRSVEDLEALSHVSGSPAIYYQRTSTSRLELMRASSISSPIQTHIQGGDFSVVLKRISNQSQRVR
jgi:hypothetical protein